MEDQTLESRSVSIFFSDPWDIVSETGEQASGTIVRWHETGRLEIRLQPSLNVGGCLYDFIDASFRHAEATKEQLLCGEITPCNFSVHAEEGGNELSLIGGLRLMLG